MVILFCRIADLFNVTSRPSRAVYVSLDISRGDDAFAKLLRKAFAYAEDNWPSTDAVLTNRAAILALGVILGDDQVARSVCEFVSLIARSFSGSARRGALFVLPHGDLLVFPSLSRCLPSVTLEIRGKNSSPEKTNSTMLATYGYALK
jgi:hypothetical protein